VSDISGWALSPSATVVSANPTTGIATAAWTSQVTGEATMRVWVSTYSNTGGTWSTPVQIGTASVSGLKITNSSAGGTLIAWLSASTVNTGTQALNLYTIPVSGTTVSDLVELGASPYSAVKVGLSDANTIVATWAGASQTVKLARKSAGVWAATANLGTGSPASESDLDVVVNADEGDLAWTMSVSLQTWVSDGVLFATANRIVWCAPILLWKPRSIANVSAIIRLCSVPSRCGQSISQHSMQQSQMKVCALFRMSSNRSNETV